MGPFGIQLANNTPIADLPAIRQSIKAAGDASFGETLASIQQQVPPSALSNVDLDEWQRNFRFDFVPGFPSDLREKLESMWKNCKNTEDRKSFVLMYANNFRTAPYLPDGKPVWSGGWKTELKATLDANMKFVGKTPIQYRAELYRQIQMARELLQ